MFSKSTSTVGLSASALPVRVGLSVILLTLAACVGPRIAPPETPEVFYTLTGEIALERGEPRVAALQYTAAAKDGAADFELMARASAVTSECLQPSLTAAVAAHWLSLDPHSLDAHRTAARAALALAQIGESARQFRIVLTSSPRGTDAEIEDLETELNTSDNVFGARQLADRLAASFPNSAAALRLQAFAALRADDPAAAATDFSQALALTPPASGESTKATEARRELKQGLWRARILAGDSQEPLAEARALAESDASPANVLDYALLLLAAQQNPAAVTQLEALTGDPDSQPVALRLLGLIEFQQNDLDAASKHFTELLTTGKFVDDSFYYLGLIAERRADLEKALRLYAQVQNGDNAVAALLRASNILQTHGAAAAAQEILDHLLQDEPEHAPEVLAARAKMFSDTGNSAQALAVLDRGRLQYPDSVDLRYAIATTDEEAGHVNEALKELKEVMKLRPDDPAALNAYGYTLADHNRELAHARAYIERAYAAAPKNAAILDSLGWVLYRQGHTEQALPYLAAAFADDRGADIGAHYGEVLWRLGRHDEADKIWNEAVGGDADSRLLNATRQRLHASP